MAAVGGSIESVSLGGRSFAVAFDADSQRKLGGDENEFQANGDRKTGRLIKTVVGLTIGGLTLSIDDSRDDQEFLQELSNRKGFFPGAITFASGETYQGDLQLTGETQYSSQTATAAVTLMGPGTLTKQ